jgi:hypothetical protein
MGRDDRERGSVVVRWRVMDGLVGRLFDRGLCECAREDSGCPDAPAWQIRQVGLSIAPVAGTGAEVGGSAAPLTVLTGCAEAELNTDFCLAEGDYDLRLTAAAYTQDSAGAYSVPVPTRTPAAVRRRARGGQIINLDAVIITVNIPPVVPAPDGGAK